MEASGLYTTLLQSGSKNSLCVVLNATIHPQASGITSFGRTSLMKQIFNGENNKQGIKSACSWRHQIILVSYPYRTESHEHHQQLFIFLYPSTVKVWQDISGSWCPTGKITEKIAFLMNKLFHFLTECFLKIKLKTNPLFLKLIFTLLFPYII